MKIAAALLLCLVSLGSSAADRNAKIRQLMEAQGLLGMFQQEMAQSKAVARERANQMVDQFMQTLSPPT